MPRNFYEFGPFTADPEIRALMRDGKVIPLAPKAFDVLLTLIQSGGTPISREHLLQAVWGDSFVEEANVTNAVWVLRKALGDENGETRYIVTIPRRGYRFAAPVRERAPVPATELEIEEYRSDKLVIEERESSDTATQKPFRLFWFGAGLILVVMAVGYLGRRPSTPPTLRWEQLTNFPDSVRSPALSPDGRMLAFLRCSGTGIDCPGQLYLKMLPDGEPVALTHGAMTKATPTFAPDGARIAFTGTQTWSTWTVPVPGGEPSQFLPNASGLTWIGNDRLLFSETRRGIQRAIVTSKENRLESRDIYVPASPHGMAHFASLSPDRRWVLIGEMDLNGWLPCRLLPFDGSTSGNPVGPADAQCKAAAWSPDGHWMYFEASVAGASHIWRQRFPDGASEQLTSGVTEETGIAMAPDGKSLVTAAGTAQSSVWVHDSSGDRQVSQEGYAFRPALSPDGAKVFYLVRRAIHRPSWIGELWSADMNGRHRERVLTDFLISHYDVSADGKRLVFDAFDAKGNSRIWVASTERLFPPRQLSPSDDASEQRAFFGQSGDIFFLREERNGLRFVYRMRADGVSRFKATPEPILFLVNITPDEKWAIVWKALPSQPEVRGTLALPIGGGEGVVLCACSAGPKWRESPLVSWPRNRRHVLIGLPGMEQARTVVLPTSRGGALPDLPTSRTLTQRDLAESPRASIISETSVAPGVNADVFAFTRVSTHQNLYRIYLPE